MSLAKTAGALYYNLNQISAQKSFSELDGVYEILCPQIKITPENTQKVLLSPPTNIEVHTDPTVKSSEVVYYFSSVNSSGISKPFTTDFVFSGNQVVNLSWVPNPLAHGTVIFKRVNNTVTKIYEGDGNFYADTGGSGVTDTRFNTFTAFTHYEHTFSYKVAYLSVDTQEYQVSLTDFTKLNIYTQDDIIGKSINFNSIWVLDPIICSLYLSLYFNKADFSYLNSEFFSPRIFGYSDLPEKEKVKEWAKGVKYLLWAISYYSRLEPSVYNLQSLYGIFSGIPFAYNSGVITEITENYIKVDNDMYIKRHNSEVPFVVGDTIKQFDLLFNSPILLDYYNNSSYIIKTVENNINVKHITVEDISTIDD